jgi:cysteine desulfurase/selenocysteine lyase
VKEWSEIRRHFPALDRAVYLNTAGGGPLCQEAYHNVRAYYEEVFADGDIHWDRHLAEVENTRAKLADMLGASPEEIAFLPNASAGLNHVADLIAGNVVALADDFPSVTLPWLGRGRQVLFLDSDEDGTVSHEKVDQALGESSAQILCVGHVQYRTGFRIDLEGWGEIARRHGARFVVDATQSFATLPLHVPSSHLDALVFSGYKWLCAGYGIAALYLGRDILDSTPFTSIGWRSNRVPYAMVNRELDLTTEARGLEMGHPPFAGVFALKGALDLLASIGLDRIQIRIRELTELLHRGLDDYGIPIVSPRPPEHRSGITMLAVDDPARLASDLKKKGIFVSARGKALRVSLHYYNDETDIERFFAALENHT